MRMVAKTDRTHSLQDQRYKSALRSLHMPHDQLRKLLSFLPGTLGGAQTLAKGRGKVAQRQAAVLIEALL